MKFSSAQFFNQCGNGEDQAFKKFGALGAALESAAASAVSNLVQTNAMADARTIGCFSKNENQGWLVGAVKNAVAALPVVCNALLLSGVSISTVNELTPKTEAGLQSLYNFIKTHHNPVLAAAVILIAADSFVEQHGTKATRRLLHGGRGFLCMTAQSQIASVCEQLTHLTLSLGAAYLTGGVGGLAAGSDGAFLAETSTAFTKSVLSPVTHAKAIVSGAVQIAKNRSTLAVGEAVDASARGLTRLEEKRQLENNERQKLIKDFESKALSSELDNRDYVDLAHNYAEMATVADAQDEALFMEVHNKALKNWNDEKFKDKSFSTALTNLQLRLVVKRLKELRLSLPDVKSSRSADFKSVREAWLRSRSPETRDRVHRAIGLAMKDFEDEVARRKIVRASDKPHLDFKAGTGATSDQATAAAVAGRRLPGAVHDFDDPAVEALMNSDMHEVKAAQSALIADSQMKPLLQTTADGQVIPSNAVFALMRKHKSAAELATAIRRDFNFENFNVSQAELLQKIDKHSEAFSPSIHPVKRVVVNLDRAEQGGFTVDFRNMGAENTCATVSAVVGAKNRIEGLTRARAGECRVTKLFEQKQAAFKKAVRETNGLGEIAKCSGDDCVGIPLSTLSGRDKQELLNRLAADPLTKDVRIGFVAPGIRNVPDRTLIGTHAESIEKVMREHLAETLAGERLRNITFAIDMNSTSAGTGEVSWLAGINGAPLSEAERAEVQAALARAVNDLNGQLAKQNVKAQYRPAM